MAVKPKFVLISPAGEEFPTNSPVYRQRLLSQGYVDKADAPEPPKPAPRRPSRPAPKPEPVLTPEQTSSFATAFGESSKDDLPPVA